MTTVATPTVHDRLFVGGDWDTPSTTTTITVRSASTEEIIGEVPDGSAADIDRSVAAARRALPGWSAREPAERATFLERFADELTARAEQVTTLVSAQNGMPIALSRQIEGGFPALLLRYYAGLIREQEPEEQRPGLLGGSALVRRDPVGVVAGIVPWNYPQTLAFTKIASALAAGCTVVVKPSPETVLDSYVVAEAAMAAGLPAGTLNIVPAGRETGAYLVTHPDVDKVAFTGSTAAGRAIAGECARLLRPVSLELGGKSAAILLDDADLSGNAENLAAACLANNGQTCYLSTRILAPRSRYQEVVDAFTELARGLRIGDALDPGTQLGPMATAGHRERVESYIARGRESGARVTAGGGRPDRRGWFVDPTVFSDVDNNAVIAREEIFGPVLAVIPYTDIDEAVRLANDSDYGLGGTIWTRDQDRGVDVARKIQSGTIGINHYVPEPSAPFGGVKASGLGREFGPEGLAAYQQLKSIYLPQ